MGIITQEMKDVAAKTGIFAVATSSKNGEPNVVSITFVKILSDDEILVMDNFMQKTEANLKENPRISVACWYIDPETHAAHAYQFKGDARIETSGPIFEEGRQWVKAAMPVIDSKAAVIVKVTDVYNLEPQFKK